MTSTSMAGDAGHRAVRERLPRRLGIVPAACRRGRAVPAPLLEGAKGVQLAEACHQSHRERRWVDLPKLSSVSFSEDMRLFIGRSCID